MIISSGATWGGSDEVAAAYSAAKSGLRGLVTAPAHQLERFGILVNAIAPGTTCTGRSWSAEERIAREQATPLGLGGTEPIAQMSRTSSGPAAHG